MKKRFLPFSLLLVIMILGQSVIADQGGHYVPRKQTNNAESFMGSLRANQKTGLIDPADMLKAMQAPATRGASDDPLYWINMGPDNMGGQTTAIVYDNQGTGIVYIGSKGGGVYKSYNYGHTWHHVGGLDLMVSCMAQDANGVIYVGTGDCDDAATHNGLGEQGYDNSFVGTGVYRLVNDEFEQVVAATEDSWLFVNDLAVADGKVLAATNEGLMCSSDGGRNWSVAVEGKAVSVKVGSDNTIVAAVDGHVYVGRDVNHLEDHSGTTNALEGDSLLPQVTDGMIDLAIAASDPNVIYASFIKSTGVHIGIFVSNDKGETWRTALPGISTEYGHNVYADLGLYNHGIVVDPENAGILYVLGYNLWSLTATPNNGFYQSCQLTGQSYYYLSDYIHVGLHAMVFNPNNSQECYVGTDGGVYKATGRFTFSNCNRNYVTARMFGVAYSGKDTRVLAGGLDHGTVYIPGDANGNSLETGYWINPSGDNLGMFSESSSAGSCAISSLNANTFFVTYKEGGMARTETAGEDWVSTSFTSYFDNNNFSYITFMPSTTSFRMPVLLHENYNNQLNPETTWYFNETGHHQDAGTTVQVKSNNNYPFNYTLTAPIAAGDSIEVHDPVTSYFFVATTNSFIMTRTPLQFDKEAEWYQLSGDKAGVTFKGDPLCMSITADGDNMFVGFKDGKFFRISNLNTVVDSETGNYIIRQTNPSMIILNPDCLVTTTQITLPIDGQCVTSVAVDPRDGNKVLVTCGNYGNEDYVFYSTNALSDEPTFVSKQGDLPKMPVYSSVIDMTTGDVIIGTERGIYRTKNLSTWTFDGEAMGKIPVMELKQQRLSAEDTQTVNHTDEGDFITDYPGVHNTGIIYAATYGRGVFRCENYKITGAGITENPTDDNLNVNMYPNPVSSQATLSFDLKESCNVSYQVFDLTGRMVMNQNMGRMSAGEQQININAENLSSGSYILRLNQGAKNCSVKFMVY
ncbi:MAG: T9SS type A sorting domain-containing protein [Bacteroidales bacterium]|nr:T9SS type A sorting domain-containing protein [Bacteroidales bacterium]